MTGTKAKWYKYPKHPASPYGTTPSVSEPSRPAPVRTYPKTPPGQIPRYPNLPPYKSPPARPGPIPHGDPRFPGYVPERPARPVSPPPRPVVRRPPAVRTPNLPKVRFPISPFFNPGLGYIERLPEFIFPNQNPDILPKLPINWHWCSGPVPWEPAAPHFYWISKPYWGTVGACHIGYPQYGQPFTQGEENTWGGAIPPGYTRSNYGRGYHIVNTQFDRRYDIGTIEQDYPLNPQPQPYQPYVSIGFPANPNIDRWLPSTTQPFAPPGLEVGFGTPIGDPTAPGEFNNPEAPYTPDFGWQVDISTSLAPPVPGGPAVPVPLPPIPPVKREPPPRGERQRKVITKTKAIGIALYKALDAASESAEVVDAIYDALPDDVKKRWKQADRMGDNFGQYGLGGADWKLRALYYNWHRVDVVKAIKNIIKNELQDRVIGGMQAGLPNNTGAAHSQGEKKLAKWLDEWFASELGL